MQASTLLIAGESDTWIAQPWKRGQMPMASSAGFPRLGCQARCARGRVLLTWRKSQFPFQAHAGLIRVLHGTGGHQIGDPRNGGRKYRGRLLHPTSDRAIGE